MTIADALGRMSIIGIVFEAEFRGAMPGALRFKRRGESRARDRIVGARALCLIMLALFSGSTARGQSNVPILSGGAGFFTRTQGGANLFSPVLAPVLAAPFGEKWLIESRADLREVVFRQNGRTGPYQGQFFDTLEYLQLDYNANSHLTLTAGRFLTPFGIFNERVGPIWINKLQDAPFIAAIGTARGYGDGFMARGALVSNKDYTLHYTAYFSTLSTLNKFESQRTAGGRVGIFVPRSRVEWGLSYGRKLQDVHMNSVGVYLSWDPYSVPLDLKGEWAHSRSGHGYWIQAAYRLSQFRGGHFALGRLEPVFRMQQFFRSQPMRDDSLPSVNTRRPEFGLNYYLPREVRLNASYSREGFSRGTNVNIWQLGITYRFLFPVWPGESK